MNNNLLFFGLAGVGLWYLSKPKTAAPVNPASALPNTSYAPVGTQSPPFTPGQVLNTVTGAVTDLTTLWGSIKDAAGTIKTSLPGQTPPTKAPSVPSTSVAVTPGGSAPTVWAGTRYENQ